jgi:hypothetical protein
MTAVIVEIRTKTRSRSASEVALRELTQAFLPQRVSRLIITEDDPPHYLQFIDVILDEAPDHHQKNERDVPK